MYSRHKWNLLSSDRQKITRPENIYSYYNTLCKKQMRREISAKVDKKYLPTALIIQIPVSKIHFDNLEGL